MVEDLEKIIFSSAKKLVGGLFIYFKILEVFEIFCCLYVSTVLTYYLGGRYYVHNL